MTFRLAVLWVMPRPVVLRMMRRRVMRGVALHPSVPRMLRHLVGLRAMFRLAVLRMFRPVGLRVVIRPVKFLALLRARTGTLATSIRTADRPLPRKIFRATLSRTTGRPTKCADAEIHCDHRGNWIALRHKIKRHGDEIWGPRAGAEPILQTAIVLGEVSGDPRQVLV